MAQPISALADRDLLGHSRPKRYVPDFLALRVGPPHGVAALRPLGGLFWDITRKRLEKKAYATEESVGEGHVILFAEDPAFRAAWEGLHKLLLNGVLFGPSM